MIYQRNNEPALVLGCWLLAAGMVSDPESANIPYPLEFRLALGKNVHPVSVANH